MTETGIGFLIDRLDPPSGIPTAAPLEPWPALPITRIKRFTRLRLTTKPSRRITATMRRDP
jgi:hypothetical protein